MRGSVLAPFEGLALQLAHKFISAAPPDLFLKNLEELVASDTCCVHGNLPVHLLGTLAQARLQGSPLVVKLFVLLFHLLVGLDKISDLLLQLLLLLRVSLH